MPKNKKLDEIQAFLLKKGFSCQKLKRLKLSIYRLDFDERFQFVIWSGVFKPKYAYQDPILAFHCGLRIHAIEKVWEEYAAEVLSMPQTESDPPMFTILKTFSEISYTTQNWIDSVIDPIIQEPDRLFELYWGCLKNNVVPEYFDDLDNCDYLIRSISSNVLSQDFSSSCLEKERLKHESSSCFSHPHFVRKFNWLSTKCH